MKYLSICAIFFGLILQDNANAAAPAYTVEKQTMMTPELTDYVQRYKDATELDERFLKNFPASGVLDLSSLTKVTRIYGNFLIGRKKLEGVILPPNLEGIGSNFLAHCSGLTTIDLTPLAKITGIGNNFLIGCKGLRKIDLSPLKEITSIGVDFLGGCEGLREIDLSPLKKITSIGFYFLRDCSGLTTIDLSSLAGIIRIPHYFLKGCSGLTKVDLSPLVLVEHVDSSLLPACSSLMTVMLPCTLAFAGVDFSRITTLSSGMMIMDDGTIRLPHKRVNHIRSIISQRYEKISYFGEVKLQPLAHVRELCPNFLAGNKLHQVDLLPLENVEVTGDGFLSENALLEALVI